MKQDQLFVLLSIVIAITGVLIIVDVLPQFLVVPLFILEYGINMTGSLGDILMGIAFPLATVLVGAALILRRFNIAEKLAYVEFVTVEDEQEDAGEEHESSDAAAELKEIKTVVSPGLSDEDDEVFNSDDTLRSLWGETVPKVAIAVLGFYLAATGLVPVVSVLAKVLLVRDAGSLEPSLSLVGPEFTSGLEGVVKLLVAFLLITQYANIIRAWRRIWGEAELS